ncbi:MAG: ABC transporter permease [Ruminococcus sp.]|nr:ABC transporter permease [Ruminococcus sp.]
MGAILKRELSAYFNSAIAYVVMAVYFFFSGLYFYFYCFEGNTTSLSGVFNNMIYIILFLVPIITMKSFAEEKRQKTDQALLTAPVNLTEIVMGKFFGAYILYAICSVIFLVFSVVIAFFAAPSWGVILCTFIGILLFGAALIAINIFISVLTESMVVAAIFGMAVGFIILMMSTFTSVIPFEWLSAAFEKINFIMYYVNFSYGLLNITDIIFFLSVTALFVFFTVRVLEKRRWS